MLKSERRGSSAFRHVQTLSIEVGTCSSQSNLISQIRWSKIFTLMMTGASQPKTSNIFAICETSMHLVRQFEEGEVDTVRLKQTSLVSHDNPSALAQSGDSEMVMVSRDSSSSGSIEYRTLVSLEFHLQSKNQS